MNRLLQILLPQYEASTRIWLSSLGTSGIVHVLVGAAVVTWLGTIATQLFPPRQGSNSIELTASQLIEVPVTESADTETPPVTLEASPTPAEPESVSEPMKRQSTAVSGTSTLKIDSSVGELAIRTNSIKTPHNTDTQHPDAAVDAGSTMPRAKPVAQQPTTTQTSAASVVSHHDAGQLDAIPTRLYSPQPEYPTEALQLGREGRVILRVVIKKDGSVSTTSVLRSSGHAALDDAARRAVLKWKFEAPKRLGVAVQTEIGVPIRFQIERPF